MVVCPARSVAGALRPPGDKSISHRYAMLAAIAEGDTRLENFSTGADCASTLGCVRALGVEVERTGNSVLIRGRGHKLQAPESPLDCGNSGSTMRMLSGILAGQDFESELTGDESLSRRPMARIITPLEMMGAKITAQAGGRPPLRVRGGKLKGIRYTMPVASAQVKSCVLFAGLLASGETVVSEPIVLAITASWRCAGLARNSDRWEMKLGLPAGKNCGPLKLRFQAIFQARLSSSVLRRCFRARN